MSSLYPHTQFVVRADWLLNVSILLCLLCFFSVLKVCWNQLFPCYSFSAGRLVLRYFIPHFWKYYRIIRHRSLTFFTYFCKHMRSSIICMLSGNCVNVACMYLRILKTSQTKFLGNACTDIQNLVEAITRFCFDFYLSSFLLPLPTLPSQNKTTNKKKKI